MRAWLFAILLIAAAVPVGLPAASAQTGPFAADAEGDVAAVAGFTDQSAPLNTQESGPADLLGLDLVESDDAVSFVLMVKSVESNLGAGQYLVEFGFRDLDYFLYIGPWGLDGEMRANFYSVEEEDDRWDWDQVARLEVTVDTSAHTLTVVLPKEYVRDSDERTAIRGDLFKDVVVQSEQAVWFSSFLFHFRDRLPDSGDAGNFNLSKGGFSNGHLVLASDDPFRVSNGGSNSFLIQAVLRNSASFEDDVALTAEGVPDGWDVTVPKRQRVPASGDVTVNVLVSMPFAHEHGGVSEFSLKAESAIQRGVYATVRMGVLHTPIPQPAGHHDELYFHASQTSASQGTLPFNGFNPLGMNTDSDHSQDVAEVAPNRGATISDSHEWIATLDPSLGMGLDFDMEREGEMTAVFNPKVTGQATVRARLYLLEADDRTLLAEGESAPQEMTAGQPATFVFPLNPEEEADYVPYAKGQNLQLVIEMEGLAVHMTSDATLAPTLDVVNSKVKLPLNEYRDVVTDVASQGPLLALVASGPLEKSAKPGSTMTYAFNVTNNAPAADTFVAEVAGADADVGAVVPVESFRLEPGESRSIVLGVTVPYEAAKGQEFEVLLLVRSQTDPSNMALARTYTTVAFGEAAQPDETERLLAAQNAEQETPGLGVALVALALVGAALVARRR